MQSFVADAPIRKKLAIAFATLTGLVGLAALAALLSGAWIAGAVGVVLTLAAGAFGAWCREAICTPYVTTVVRMEGLATGDLTSPILFTEYRDCVGRMTAAMHSFRDTAIAQQRYSEDQNRVVERLKDCLESLSSGDLTREISEDLPEGYQALKVNYNKAVATLRDLIAAVVESTEAIRTGSTEITSASEDLARRTESNAASLAETSAAIAQMDGRLRASADSSGTTVARADQAIAVVGTGRATADEAVQAMERVSESAKGIDTVIEGLDKIAFQTRVLAMNAAVEAGRAGEAGRGFAVVADLVSALAMRAEEEAKRARDQLTVTQSDIGSAVEAVQRVDSALGAIVGDVTEVHRLLGEMAEDNRAQSSAVSEIMSILM